MSEKQVAKQHLEITDLPQDNLGVLFGVRKPLITAFNKCRDYPYKLKLLKEFLKFMHSKCVEAEKRLEAKVEIKEVVKPVTTETKEGDK